MFGSSVELWIIRDKSKHKICISPPVPVSSYIQTLLSSRHAVWDHRVALALPRLRLLPNFRVT